MRQDIEEQLKEFAPCAELMPGVVVIQDITEKDNFKITYMSPNGLQALGVSLEELRDMEGNYYKKFFNHENLAAFRIKLKELISGKDPEAVITFFQQVRIKDREDWAWYFASLKIFSRDSKSNPTHLVTVAFPLNTMKHIPNKSERLLAENLFYEKNFEKFVCLGRRARQVLRLVALGKSSAEIAEELRISVATVNTHRRNIKKKLDITTTYEFTEYAHAFDLI